MTALLQVHPTRTLTLREAPPPGATIEEQLEHVLRAVDDETTLAQRECARAVLESLVHADAVSRDIGVSDEQVDVPIEFAAWVMILASQMFRTMLDLFNPEGDPVR